MTSTLSRVILERSEESVDIHVYVPGFFASLFFANVTKRTVHRFCGEKPIIIRQIVLFFADLADYVEYLFYFCVNKTHKYGNR